MTISTADLREEYTAASGQTVFSFNFRIFETTDITVYQTASGSAYDDSLNITTAYTVSMNADQSASPGGSITLTSGATLGDKITIVSNIPETRTTDFQVGGEFSADVVDNEYDRVVSLAKQAGAKSSRAMLAPESEQNAGALQLPDSLTRSNKVLSFDASGNPDLTSSTKSEIDTAVSAINAGAVTQAVNHIKMATLSETTGAYDLVYQIANDLYTPSLNDVVTVSQYNSLSAVRARNWVCTSVNYSGTPSGDAASSVNSRRQYLPVRDNDGDGKMYSETDSGSSTYYVFEPEEHTIDLLAYGVNGTASTDLIAFNSAAALASTRASSKGYGYVWLPSSHELQSANYLMIPDRVEVTFCIGAPKGELISART